MLADRNLLQFSNWRGRSGWLCVAVLAAISARAGAQAAPRAPAEPGAQQAVQSAAEQQLRELCETILCYPPGAVHVTLQNGQVATLDSDFPLPIVDHDIVYAFPGKTIFIAGDVKDGKVVNLHAVAAPEKPQNVLRVHLFQEAGKPATFLTITNYFGVPVKYQAGMRLPQKQDFLSTSTCPVRAGGSASRESWPHPIFQLALHDFEVLGKGVAASCD